jgi:hypothetical protein
MNTSLCACSRSRGLGQRHKLRRGNRRHLGRREIPAGQIRAPSLPPGLKLSAVRGRRHRSIRPFSPKSTPSRPIGGTLRTDGPVPVPCYSKPKSYGVLSCWCAPPRFLEVSVTWSNQCLAECATAAFVGGRGNRLAGGRTPPAGAAAPAAAGSRSWCRQHRCRARRWPPPPRWWAKSTSSSFAHRCSGAAIGRPRSGSCQVPHRNRLSN